MFLNLEGPLVGVGRRCQQVLLSMPKCFGTDSQIEDHLRDIDRMQTFIAAEDGETVGFLALQQHSRFSEEIFLLAVRADRQRHGIGRLLVGCAEEYLRQEGVEYLEAKPLLANNPDITTAVATAFYLATGFRLSEPLGAIWDDSCPVPLMVKKL